MIAIVWRYVAAAGREADFERAYGPQGAWAELFRRSSGYLRTELLAGEPGAYLTFDYWRDAADWDAFRERHAEPYARLDGQCDALTRSEERLGLFTVLDPVA